MAISGVLGVVACLRYEMAIVLPEDNNIAKDLFSLSLILVVLSSLFALIFILLSRNYLAEIMGMPALSWLLWFVPIAVLFRGVNQSLNYHATRDKQMPRIAISRVAQSSATATEQVVAGVLFQANPAGLIVGHITGILGALSVLLFKRWHLIIDAFKQIGHFKAIVNSATRYKSFPKYDVPASILNTATYEVPVIILGIFFVELVVGEFSLAMRVVALPSVFVSASVAQAFFQEASVAYNKEGSASNITAKTVRKLFYISVPFYIILGVSAPYLFTPIFGEQWLQAGFYIAILCPLCCFMLIVAPVSQMFFVYGKQGEFLIFQIVYFFISISAFIIGGLQGNAIIGIVIFTILGCIRYLFMLIYILKISDLFILDVIFISKNEKISN